MKLLEAEPTAAPETAQQAPPEAPQEQAPAPAEAGRTCPACGAAMQEEQQWCLACGAAAPGSLGDRPGWRAARTVIALTAVLVLGAAAASYAALRHDNKASSKQQVAATPPPAAQQTTPPPAATTTAPTTTTPTTPPASTTGTLPKVHTHSGTTPGSTVTPIQPTTPTTPPASTGTTPATPPASTGTTPSNTGTGTTTTPTPTGPVAIDLAKDAGTTYDPYTRAAASGKTEFALDGNALTSWYVDPKTPQEVGVGYDVKLDHLRGIRVIKLQTPTPGFKIEVYATDLATPPPNILDARWSHIRDVTDVGAKHDGKETIALGAGTSKYRNLLLWFTKPPTDGPRVRLAELQLLG